MAVLCSIEQFCDCFYHMKATPEADQLPGACLRASGCCTGKTTALLARLRVLPSNKSGDSSLPADPEDIYIQLYCNATQQAHAEGFLMRDLQLLSSVRKAQAEGQRRLELLIYLTNQPCHHSSSDSATSCTDQLLLWHHNTLKPLGVELLSIRAAFPYRSHWDATHMSEDELVGLGRRAWGRHRERGGGDRRQALCRAHDLLRSAREGTSLLMSASAMDQGVTLSAFCEADWRYLLSLCEPALADLHARDAPPFTTEVKSMRATLDRFTQSVYDSFRPHDGGERDQL